MKRDILFRGKKADASEWIYGYFERMNGYSYIVNENMRRIREVVESGTVGQYTGLNDKNGKKIFEGDILRANNNNVDLHQVVFGKFGVIDVETESPVDNCIGWYCKVLPTDALSKYLPFCLPTPLTDYYISRCSFEVVGNIYDNPELLGMENENETD
ncbi:MAG: YopX family protein [Oscillospiraceae bacterium]|nr:YopX family protein [Oscillospiraceae bacterium]